jgi:hypothetical protein
MPERRFNGEEIAEILQLATSGESLSAPVPAREGLTLSELQAIGNEVGIPPRQMAEAAHALMVRSPAPLPGPILGMPRAVSQTVPLPRGLSEEGWNRLVVQLRETFGGAGEVEVQGSLRSWKHGDVEVHLEPASSGSRIRMLARRGDAVAYLSLGGFLLIMGAGLLAFASVTGEALAVQIASGVIAALGAGQISWGKWALPRWGRLRGSQLQQVAHGAWVERLAPRSDPAP